MKRKSKKRRPFTLHSSPFTVIAHRGARGYAPENTLAAFEKAIELGARWIELDVQYHDRSLWVFHDPRLERCTNGRGALSTKTAAALRKLDAGNGERIPFLHEALDRIGRRARVNIELKTANRTGAAVAALLREYLERGWKPDDFLVSSFHLPELRDFKRRLPEIPLGVLLAGVPLDLAASGTDLGASVLGIAAEFADAELIDDAHRRGMKVFAYTVNEPDDIARLKRLGVDGVFTDFPDRAPARLSR